jgi:molecular chaperone DnaK (HSP70)
MTKGENMSEHLENSTERLITACRSMKEWAEHVLEQLEKRQAQFQAGRAEVDKALAELQEERANFIKDSSEAVASETSQALDTLAARMEELLAGGPKAEPVPPPLQTPPPASAQSAPPVARSQQSQAKTPPASRSAAASHEADDLPEAVSA